MRVATHCTCESHKLSRLTGLEPEQFIRCILKQRTASLSKDDAKVLLIFSAKVQKMHFTLREFFTLLDKLYAIFHTNYSMYSDY